MGLVGRRVPRHEHDPRPRPPWPAIGPALVGGEAREGFDQELMEHRVRQTGRRLGVHREAHLGVPRPKALVEGLDRREATERERDEMDHALTAAPGGGAAPERGAP